MTMRLHFRGFVLPFGVFQNTTANGYMGVVQKYTVSRSGTHFQKICKKLQTFWCIVKSQKNVPNINRSNCSSDIPVVIQNGQFSFLAMKTANTPHTLLNGP